MIKAVVFDADETLVDLQPAISAALDAVLDDVRDQCPDGELTRAHLAEDWRTVFGEDPEAPVPLIRRRALGLSLARIGLADQLDRQVELFFAVRYRESRPFPDALAALAELRAAYLLGYATNGNSDADRCGLAGEFAFELYATRDGLPKKPAPEFFTAVAGASALPPERIAYVGDNYHHDVVAPAAAGMRTVWVNRSGRDVPGPVTPDVVIDRLAQLPGALEALARG